MNPSKIHTPDFRWLALPLLAAGSLLTACQPGTQATALAPMQPSALPGAIASSSPSASPSASMQSSSSPAPASASPAAVGTPLESPAANLASTLVSLRIVSSRTQFLAPGQAEALQAIGLDTNGQEINLTRQVTWASSRPENFRIDAQGQVQVLAQEGTSEITAQLPGSELIARLPLVVGAQATPSPIIGRQGGGGGGGSILGSTQSTPTATPTPAPVEFQVNTTTEHSQAFPSLSMDSNGNFVVVWQSEEQDGSGTGIYAQRFSAEGQALGGEMMINQLTQGAQTQPDVTMMPGGIFMVVWQAELDGSGGSIQQRMYDALGNPLGSERFMNAVSAGDQSEPAAAINSQDLVVTWTSDGTDGSEEGIYARTGEYPGSLRSQFQVNQHTTGAQFASDVAMNTQGDFVVTWTSHGQADGSSYDVYARRFDRTGSPLGNEFRVNSTTSNQEWISNVSLNDSGQCVVVWHSNAQDGDGDGVYARVFDANDAALSPELAVNQTTSGHQNNAAVAIDNSGQFTVAWMGVDADSTGIYLRRFNISGNPLLAETRLNQTTAGAQTYPSLALNSTGSKAGISWASEGQDGGTSFGIFSLLWNF